MSYNVTTFSQGATGNTAIGVTGTPTWFRFTTGAKGTAEATDARHAVGMYDGTNQVAHAMVTNSNGRFSRFYSNKSIVALGTPGGVISEVVLGTVVSVSANTLNLNFTAADSNYNIILEYGT